MIAMTAGQLRRRLWVQSFTALSLIPWLIIFMGLLFKGGQLVFHGGSLAAGTCADCCGGSGCSSCVSGTACGNCTGDTPTTWHVSFSSVETAFPCTPCSYGFASAGTGSLGTYTLTQSADCQWSATASSPTINIDNTTFDCSTVDTTYSAVTVLLQKTVGYTLTATLTAGAAFPFFFDGSTTGSDCCVPINIDNANIFGYDCSSVGINGSAVATPC